MAAVVKKAPNPFLDENYYMVLIPQVDPSAHKKTIHK